MKKDEFKTVVVFRKYKEGDVIALFPEEFIDLYGNCACYMHVGQHGSVAYSGVVYNTRPAMPKEYRTLKLELEGLGYRLDVKKRYARGRLRKSVELD